jgi:hypothetical protein
MDYRLNMELVNLSNTLCHNLPKSIIMLARCINNKTAMSQILLEESGYWNLKVRPCYVCNYPQSLDKCTACPSFGVKLQY